VPLEVVGARRPREIVDVFLIVAVRRGAVGVVAAVATETPVAPTTHAPGTVSETS
jgi:hypothetical protein